MFLKVGALSLALLLASRLLGLLRESAQAAAFGASGLADIVVLMLTLPDWVAGFLASGALAFVLLPAWAVKDAGMVAATQRRVALWLMAAGLCLALGLVLSRTAVLDWLAGGLRVQQLPLAANALLWSAAALPAALLASLWATRLQHERDFLGMYGANLVVNVALIAAIAWAAISPANEPAQVLGKVGMGLACAMLLRLVWLQLRMPARVQSIEPMQSPALPRPTVWLWAALSAGLPLALPFIARSIASNNGEGELATFNYAWKLVELPLILAIQLVATLAFPAIARAVAQARQEEVDRAVRTAIAIAWTLACAAAAALIVGAPAIASLLFGWGRMDAQALGKIAEWGCVGAWGLLPQSVIAVALTVFASRGSMAPAVMAYAAATVLLLIAPLVGWTNGGALMLVMNVLLAAVAFVCVAVLGRRAGRCLPMRSMAVSLFSLLVIAGLTRDLSAGTQLVTGLALALAAAAAVLVVSWFASPDLKAALRR